MRFPGFIGPSYTLQSVSVDCQRTVNLYPEMDEAGTGSEGEVASLVATPGLKPLVTFPTGPVRGTHTDTQGMLWVAAGNVLYQVSTLWVAKAMGTLSTSIGPVSMEDNGLRLVLVDGAYGYQAQLSSGSFAKITDVNFQGASQVTFMDGYFIFNKPATNQFFLSPLNYDGPGTPFDGTMVGTAEASPDTILGQLVNQQYLYLFGTQSLEVFYDSGATFPFDRVTGTVTEIGCAAGFSIAKIQNQIFWLGQDPLGRGIVYRMQGFQPQRISTHAIEHAIAALGDLSTARAYTYQQGGHAFYCLNLPGASTTWVYDVATQLWHERAALSLGQYQRHSADCHAFAYQTNVVGDYASGALYALDPATYTDNGAPILRERTAPHVSKNRARLFHKELEIHLESGRGRDGGVQGSDPQVMLQWSDDAGHTWSTERSASAGALGAYRARVRFHRLGSARDRVYRMRVSDPNPWTVLGAELDIEAGQS